MNHRNDENLKELFGKFFDAEQVEKCLEDVQKAEQILREYPAPEPDDMLIANIKAEIAMRLPAKRTGVFTHIGYKAANIAAAVIILAAIGMSLFEKDGSQSKPREFTYASILPTAIWESDDIAADDMDLAGYTVEIEQIENELMTLQSGEEGLDSENAVNQMEMELMETESDFWKG